MTLPLLGLIATAVVKPLSCRPCSDMGLGPRGVQTVPTTVMSSVLAFWADSPRRLETLPFPLRPPQLAVCQPPQAVRATASRPGRTPRGWPARLLPNAALH